MSIEERWQELYDWLQKADKTCSQMASDMEAIDNVEEYIRLKGKAEGFRATMSKMFEYDRQ